MSFRANVPPLICLTAVPCHTRMTPNWSVPLFGEGNSPTLPPSFSFHSRSRGRRRHSSGRGCQSSCAASRASGIFRATKLAICICCSCIPPLALYPKSLVFPYCAHMRCSSLANGPKFGRLPSPYLEGHLYTSTQSSSKDESFLRCTSTIPAAVVSVVPIITLPRPICIFGFLRISSVSSRH